MLTVDPVRLAQWQLRTDRERTKLFPDLLARKVTRMRASPLAFLRGAAPLYYRLLKEYPTVADGAGGEGWLLGDAHLENFGAYHPDTHALQKGAKHRPDAVAFDLNDFDEAVIAPWRYDVLRLTTSLILGGRELGADGPRVLGLSETLLASYADYAARPAEKLADMPPAPAPVKALIDQVCVRSQHAMLNGRTILKAGERRFAREARYRDLPRKLARKVPEAFGAYVASIPKGERPKPEQVEIIDMAQRVAGTGSLGVVRVAVLVSGKGTVDGRWIFDMKEQGTPSAKALVRKQKVDDDATRVLTGFRSCVLRPPAMLGVTKLGSRSMFGRRLAPQEDKLDLRHIADKDLDALAHYLGALLGSAHARGATKTPKRGWTEPEQEQLLDRAIAMAGLHEAAYLAYCKLDV